MPFSSTIGRTIPVGNTMRFRLGWLWLASLVLASSSALWAQDDDQALREGPVQLRLYAGAAALGLGDIETRFDEAVQILRVQGLPVSVQRDFSPQVVVGAEAVYRLFAPRKSRPGLALGVGVERAYTEAFSGYEDFSGTLDFQQEAAATLLEGVVQGHWHVYGPVSAALTLRGGRLQTRSLLRESLNVTAVGNPSTTEVQVEGTAFAWGGGVSLRYVWRALGLSAEVGYRAADVTTADRTTTAESGTVSQTVTDEGIETDEGFSGLRFTLGAFFTL